MKINEPVTDHEVVLEEGQYIVTTADLKGMITSVNRTFEKVTGFRRDEVIGKNHNIVRHPDMPPEAFAELWERLKAGKPWVGIVKNRCKNGDYYWVKASVAPRYRHGEIIGYQSVRTRPSREEVERAEAFYREVRAGRADFSRRPGRSGEKYLSIHRFLGLMFGEVALTLGAMAWLGMAGAGAAPLVGVGLVGLAVVGVTALGFRRSLLTRLGRIGVVLDRIAQGNSFEWLEQGENDEFGHIQDLLQTAQTTFGFQVSEMQDRADELAKIKDCLDGKVKELESARAQLDQELQRTREQARELTRVQEALEAASAALMIVDEKGDILCLNESARQLMKRRAAEIQRRFPQFDPTGLTGRSGDLFDRGWRLTGGLEAPFEDDIIIGKCELGVVVTPVRNDQGEQTATVVEWIDRTDEAEVERQFQAIVHAASYGNLGKRISVDDKEGFFAELSEGVNQLMDVLERLFQDTAQVFKSLANGELNVTIETEYEGAFAKLKEDVNTTITNFTQVIEQIRYNTNALGHAVHEITEGNGILARRIEQQAANLEETASSMEQITSTLRHSADNSQQAAKLSKKALERASEGGVVVAETVTAMDKITEASKRIADITSVIDGIAFQTNLLALNAAVEAARAGEQGRGFAVVATEVRNLAQRSASAAKEIKALIDDSVAKVQEGSTLVNQSGETLDEIVKSVEQVNAFFAEIAAASAEQYAGIDQVNQAVSRMDTATQKNAALVEEVAQSSQLMDEQARELQRLVSYFRVRENKPEQSEGGWDGVERRSADRPWTAPAAARSPKGKLDFAAARTKHQLWKSRLRAFLDGKETMSETEAVSHHDCDLGQWIYANGLAHYGQLDEMKELERIHAQMHERIRSVIRNHQNGEQVRAEKVFEEVQQYSDRIVELLDTLEQKVKENEVSGDKPSGAQLRAVGGGWEAF